jgi:small conductance mechanosensitive channel
MEELKQFLSTIEWDVLTPIFVNLLTGLGILILGWILSRWADRFVRKQLSNNKGIEASATVRPILATTVKYAILLAALYAALTQAGIEAASLLAVFGAAGLAIALAVQGTLSNIAAGIMLIFLRSMKVGDYVQTPSVEGTVLEIGLFTSNLRRADGVFVTVPNAQIWGSQITNFSRFDERRVDVDIALARDNDLAAAVEVLKKALDDSPLVHNPELNSAILLSTTDKSAMVQARFWIARESYRSDSAAMRLMLHEALKAEGFTLPPVVR